MAPRWTGQHLVALRRACLRFGPYAFMGPTLGVLVEYALIGLAWSPSLDSLQDDDDWRQECADLLDMHLGFDDEARKRVIGSLPEGKLKTELQAQERQTADQLSGLLASGGREGVRGVRPVDEVLPP